MIPFSAKTEADKLLTVIVSSCDAFADCWEPFAYSLRKYWPYCPFSCRLITNFKSFEHAGLKAIQVGKDEGWAKNLIRVVETCNTPYILYIQEDNWLTNTVSTPTIIKYLQLLQSDQADYLRLYPCPSPVLPCEYDQDLGELGADEQYRTSLQPAIWRKPILLDLINPAETAWQFETVGTARSRKYGRRFLSVRRFFNKGKPTHKGIDCLCTAVHKGRWTRTAIEYANLEGIKVDFSQRPRENWWHRFLRDTGLGLFISGIYSRAFRSNRTRHTGDIA